MNMHTMYSKFSEEEQEQFRILLQNRLKEGTVLVTFLKKDGSVREMNCTLNESKVLSYEKKTERTKTPSKETCPVYDIDKQEWRSFRYDSITRVKFYHESV